MNLAHIPIETLENLPVKMRSFQMIKGIRLSNKYLKRYDHRWNYDSKIYKQIEKIVRASIGKDVNDIYSKVRPLLNNVIGNTPHNFFRSVIDKPNIIVNNYPYYFGVRYQRCPDLYIDDKNKISLYKKPYIRYRIRHTKSWFLVRRKDNRKAKEKRILHELTLVKIINIPGVFKFYKKLCEEESFLIDRINKRSDPYPSSTYYNIREHRTIFKSDSQYRKDIEWWNWRESWRKREIKEAKIKIVKVQESLNKIRSGDYSEFYRSNEYLFSIPKECHHFETP